MIFRKKWTPQILETTSTYLRIIFIVLFRTVSIWYHESVREEREKEGNGESHTFVERPLSPHKIECSREPQPINEERSCIVLIDEYFLFLNVLISTSESSFLSMYDGYAYQIPPWSRGNEGCIRVAPRRSATAASPYFRTHLDFCQRYVYDLSSFLFF